ncbi:hypothetical protein B7463_g9890, partial [Scytalidium lignicola]
MLFDPSSSSLPKRSSLPSIQGALTGAAWFWGEKDEIGRLNLLTPHRIANAAKLIQTGQVINLNLQVDLPSPPLFRRETFEHKIKFVSPQVFDDLYHCNTQSGSQWDGFRHVGHKYKDDYIWYNNLTRNEIQNTSRCGMQAWAEHGIVGRGVLIDFWSYAEKNRKTYDPNTTHRISVNEILDGWLKNYNGLDASARHILSNTAPTFVGVEQTEEMLDFLHDNYFSAVAGDTPAFEAWPSNQDWFCHQFLLSLWGVPIGEMWDLEKLAKTCKERKQYEFYFSSMPTNVPGGVGSYPNAMAIF